MIWAAVRLWLLRFADPLPGDPAGTGGAWAAGMLAYAFAVIPELEFAAYSVSAIVTAAVLVRAGSPRGRAVRAAAFAWGAQAVVMLVAWLARTAYVIAFFGG
jgi:nucleotide-binding universal stress UspA family protein